MEVIKNGYGNQKEKNVYEKKNKKLNLFGLSFFV